VDMVIGFVGTKAAERAVNVAAMLPDYFKLILATPQSDRITELLARSVPDRFVLSELPVEDSLYAMNVLLDFSGPTGFVGFIGAAVVDCEGRSFDPHDGNITATHIAGLVLGLIRDGVKAPDDDYCVRSWASFLPEVSDES